MMDRPRSILACTLLSAFALVARAEAQAPTTAGEFSVEPPTLLSVGFDWKIEGDDNRNALVEVTYRRKGETPWRKALPLLRLQREWVNGGPPQANDNALLPRFPFDYVVPNMFSGSILNLDPDTEYECRFALSDLQDDWSASKNYYIADNVFIGRHDPDRMMSWIGTIWEKFPGFPELLTSEYAIKVYGQGHVVAHNYLAHWHDAIDVATYGNPDGAPGEIADRLPVSIDFYGNDIFNMGDNCIESDGGAHNIRVFRNRCFNVASQALSAQPMYGGPVYFYENLVYNAPASGSLKFVATPAGVLVYQNTFVGEVVARGPASNVHFRNNLIVAQDALDPVFAVGTYTSYSTSDYNAFHPNPGKEDSFEWNTPPSGVVADYKAQPVVRRYRTLGEYSGATGQDSHSVLVGYDVFVSVTMPDKSDPQRLYKPDGFDFRLRRGSAAVDAGVALPSINDDFTGRAPDIGAYEVGRPPPRYGPR